METLALPSGTAAPHAARGTKRRCDPDAHDGAARAAARPRAAAELASEMAAVADAIVARMSVNLRKRARDSDGDGDLLTARLADLDVCDGERAQKRARAPHHAPPARCAEPHVCAAACAECGRDFYTVEQVAEALREALALRALQERWAAAAGDEAECSYIS